LPPKSHGKEGSTVRVRERLRVFEIAFGNREFSVAYYEDGN
jgi:hypothetical protein